MKKIPLLLALIFWFGINPASPCFGYEYQLYKNNEDSGIIVFPKAKILADLNQFIKSGSP